MKGTARTTTAERTGRRLGRAWRWIVRQETHAVQWLVANGLPAGLARFLFWIVTVAVFSMLLYSVFWLTLLLLVAAAVTLTARNSDHDEPEDWAIGDQAEHKKSVFYDPIHYNDDPDPRFDDEK